MIAITDRTAVGETDARIIGMVAEGTVESVEAALKNSGIYDMEDIKVEEIEPVQHIDQWIAMEQFNMGI